MPIGHISANPDPVSTPNGGAAGSSGGSVHLASSNYDPGMVAKLQVAFADALRHLMNSQGCANLFAPASGWLAIPTAVSALAGTTYRLLALDKTTTGAQTVDASNVFLNTTGAFFTAQPDSNGQINFNIPSPTSGSQTSTVSLSAADFGAFILLHELGHEMGVFGPDLTSTVNGSNSWQVLEDCFGKTRP